MKAGEWPYDEDQDGDEEAQISQNPADAIKLEIEDIEDKIARQGGIQSCGWHASDHKDFLRVRTKHKERVKTVAFMTEMRRAVPTLDEDDINGHIESY